MDSFITQLNARVASTGEEWVEDSSYAQEEFCEWAEKEDIPHEVIDRIRKAIVLTATNVFNEAFAHCRQMLEKQITEEQAEAIIKFMDSDLGLVLGRVYAIQKRSYKPYEVYFQGLIPDIIRNVSDDWLRENL